MTASKRDYKVFGDQVVVQTKRSGAKNAQNINQLIQGSGYAANKAFSNHDEEVTIDVNAAIQYFINNVID